MKSTSRLLLISPIVLILFLSCGNKNKQAELLLQRADSAYQTQDYALALRLSKQADSIAPTDTILRRKALEIGRKSRLGIIDWQLDSLNRAFASLEPKIKEMEKKFGRMQDLEDGTTLKMILPKLAPFRNQSRTYLRIATDTLGYLDLTSVYSGLRPIKHAAIRISDQASGQSVATKPVIYDQGLNYRYVSGGRQHELVSYPWEEAIQVGMLIEAAAQADRPVEVVYLSGESKRTGISYSIEGKDLSNLVETIYLSRAYRQRTQGRSLYETISREKHYLAEKLQLRQ